MVNGLWIIRLPQTKEINCHLSRLLTSSLMRRESLRPQLDLHVNSFHVLMEMDYRK